jgi:hypothetical protein
VVVRRKVVRYEHASEERDALLAQALNAFTMGDNVVPLTHELSGDRVRGARDEGEVDAEVLGATTADQRKRRRKLRGRDSNSQPSG